jgi:hypothetical protein
MSKVKYTKSATFFFPLLEIPKAFFTCKVKNGFGYTKFTNRFINAYLKNECIKKYTDREDCMFLVIKNYQDADFERFYSTLTAFPNYLDSYDTDDCLVAIFKVSDELLPSFKLLKEGKYSEVCQKAKSLILKNNFFTHSPETIPLILEKSPTLKKIWEDKLSVSYNVDLGDQEVWGIINIEKETLSEKILNSFKEKKDLSTLGEFE